MYILKITIISTALLVIVFLSTGCQIPPPVYSSPPVQLCSYPIVVGVAVDQSGSMKWSGTTSVAADDVKPILEHISNCGGEIGVTLIRADSGKAIVRLRESEPTSLPVEPTQNKDEEDFEFADRFDLYQQNVNERNSLIEQKKKDLQPKIENYLNELALLLAQKPKGATDFWTSINRLDVFLAEGDATWRTKPHRYLIIVSDAADTIGKTKNTFKSDATAFWVNANASDKNLKDFPYKRFENFQAAVAEILSLEGVK